MHKVDVLGDELRQINPDAKVFRHRKKLDENSKGEAEQFMKRAALTMACTGSAFANQLINEISVRLKKPVVYAGVFEKASGGFVLLSVPSLKSSPCFNCLYDYTSAAHEDSNTAVEEQARRYGVKADDLHAQQGLYIDIGFVALLQAKVALTVLVHGAGKALAVLPGNLVVWNYHRLAASWLNVKRRNDCAVCNKEGWLRSRALAIPGQAPKEN
jgi:molybdopterin/thiamine biosynthesis adenylyltransferase